MCMQCICCTGRWENEIRTIIRRQKTNLIRCLVTDFAASWQFCSIFTVNWIQNNKCKHWRKSTQLKFRAPVLFFFPQVCFSEVVQNITAQWWHDDRQHSPSGSFIWWWWQSVMSEMIIVIKSTEKLSMSRSKVTRVTVNVILNEYYSPKFHIKCT